MNAEQPCRRSCVQLSVLPYRSSRFDHNIHNITIMHPTTTTLSHPPIFLHPKPASIYTFVLPNQLSQVGDSYTALYSSLYLTCTTNRSLPLSRTTTAGPYPRATTHNDFIGISHPSALFRKLARNSHSVSLP